MIAAYQFHLAIGECMWSFSQTEPTVSWP